MVRGLRRVRGARPPGLARRSRAGRGLLAALPFDAGAFERVVSGHFYGHLDRAERERFLAEARRVARELVVVDTARRPGVPPERWEERVLNDGSRHRVYKRYLTGEQLAAELGAETLFEGRWFVAARTRS